MRTHSFRPKYQRGLSLVELMVSLVIGLVATLVLMQVFSTAEERRRSTGGVVGAQNAGNLAMLSLDHDLRQAGYGVSNTSNLQEPMFNCLARGIDTDVVANPDFTFRLRPVTISDGTAGAPDQVTILRGGSMFRVTGVQLKNSTNTTKLLKTTAGYRKGDRIVIVAPDLNTGSVVCALFEITDVGADKQTITHQSATNYTNDNGVTVKSANNPTDNYGFAFASDGGEVFNIGPKPTSITYRVDANHRLLMTAGMSGTGETVLSENVLDLQAQYGVDTNNNARIDADEWTSTSPVNDADWKLVRSVRIAILVRSQEMEREKLGTNPTWAGGNFLMKNLDGSAGSTDTDGDVNNWRYYRYRVFETVVPLRNVVWGLG